MKLYNEKNNCCGCMACMDICSKQAIYRKSDKHGFVYPVVEEEKCINCGACSRICPFKNITKPSVFERKCYAVKNKDSNIRSLSSSGGVYTALTDYVLRLGGVVYGAAYTSTDEVAHIRCETYYERDKTCNSKYVQSDMCGIYKKIKDDLHAGKHIAFSGTPCQVAAVKKYFAQYRDKLLLIDVICHGVPSPMVFKEHIRYCESRAGKSINNYIFRYKKGDGRNQTPAICYDDGNIDSSSRHIRIYFDMFNENKILRESCFNCPYSSKNRTGDITIGDYWGVKDIIPEFDDGNGVSAVIINTEAGASVFEEIKDYLFIEKTTYNDIAKHNGNLKHPSKPPKHSTFWMRYKLFGWGSIVDDCIGISFFGKLKSAISKIIK